MKKDLIFITDFSKEEIFALYEKARFFKEKRQKGIPHQTLLGKTLGLIFEKHSTRTRISFEVGMFELGGHPLFISADQLQLKRGETIVDSARVFSRYLNGIVIRTYEHKDVEQLAKNATIPVINGLTNLNHPVQILTDIFTIWEKRNQIKGIKVAYVGDGNNIAYSWSLGASIMEMDLTIASPPELQPVIPKNHETLGKVEIITDPFEAVKNADIIYTDVWVSMGDNSNIQKKVEYLKDYQINKDLLAAAKSDVLVMHCLPAHRGEEITSEVLDGKHSIVFDQAENRLHVQKAAMALTMR